MSHSPHLTGAEKMLLNLGILLKKTEEIEPIIFIPLMSQGPLFKEAQKYNIECEEIPFYRWYIFKPVDNQALFENYCNNLNSTVAMLRKIILDADLDLMINNTLTCIIGLLAAISLHIPVVTWIHGILDSYLISNYDAEYRFLVDRAVTQLSQKIICNSNWTKRFFSQFIPDEKIITVYNWTYDPVEKADFESTSNTFVCLNTFDHHKGMDTLIDAAKILKEGNYQFILDLYGEGGEKNKIIQQSEIFGLSDCVKFSGRNTDIFHIYNKCLALIQPSYIEPFGMTIIEAMAHQRAVIATKSGGPQEIVRDGCSGLLVEPGDAFQLADKMAYLLEHKDIAKKMGLSGEKIFLQNFTESIAGNKFMQIMKDSLEQFTGYSMEQILIYDLLNWVHYR
jgi:glycosyltransferase involved in cell wall biosynthesis